MNSGFRYVLAGSCVIALLFIALSLWSYVPQLDIVWKPRGTISAPAPAPPAPPSGNAAFAPAGARQLAATRPSAPGPAPLSSQSTLHSPGAGALSAITQPDSNTPVLWLLTTDNAIVRQQPGGDPLLAPSVSHAPLTVFSGSYLREVRRESGWVLVLSPSRTLGWVHERQVRQVDM